MKIGPKDSKNGVAWKKSELETLETYAGVSWLIHIFLSLVVTVGAAATLQGQGFYRAPRILIWSTLVMVVFLCICPLVRVLANHQISSAATALWGILSSMTGWLQRQVEKSSFLFYMAAQVFAIAWWILALIFLITKRPEEVASLNDQDAAVMSTLAIMAMLDAVLQGLTFVGMIKCEQLVTPADGNVEETDADKLKNKISRLNL